MTYTALKLALEALQKTQSEGYNLPATAISEAITAIKAALAQPTSGDYALGYAEGFNDACKPAQQEPIPFGIRGGMAHTKDEIFNKLLAYVCSVPDDCIYAGELYQERHSLIDEAKAALAQQEPVAWWNDTGTHIDLNVSGRGTPLYTTPPQRTWVGLTDEDLMQFAISQFGWDELIEAVEAKLKEKNT